MDTTGASVISGGLWNTMSLLAPQGFVLLVSVVAARILGPVDMGRQSFISFVQISLMALLSTGMQQVLLRFVGDRLGRGRASDVRRLVRWSWRVTVITASVGAVAMVSISILRVELRAAWLLSAATCAVWILHAVPSSLLQGMQHWRMASTVTLATGAAGTVATVAVLMGGGGITGLFAVQLAVALVSLVIAQVYARRTLPKPTDPSPKHEVDRGLAVRVRRFATVSTLQALLYLVVWRRSEFLFLERYSTPGEIAMYSVAFAASSALMLVPQGLAAVFMPAMAKLHGSGETERVKSGLDRAFRLLIVLSLPLSAVAVAIGPSVLDVVYGDEYRRAGSVFAVVALVLPTVPAYFLGSSLLQTVGRERSALAASGVAGAMNVVFGLLLVPVWGALGAAWANVVAQVAASGLILILVRRAVGPLRIEAGRIFRMALASLLAGLAGAAGVASAGGPPGIALGCLLFLGAIVALSRRIRPFTMADARWIDQHVGHRARGTVGIVCRWLAPEGRRAQERGLPAGALAKRSPPIHGHAERLVTVDVFDTVLTRAVGRPHALFVLLGVAQAGQLRGGSAEAFARQRISAEGRAREKHKAATSIEHIYDEFAFDLDLDGIVRDRLLDAELEMEAQLIRPVPGAFAWLAELRATGRVCFVSDTYLPSSFLRQQLAVHGLIEEGESLYVSCEEGCEKLDGRLYRHVAHGESAALRQMTHIGNDAASDVRSARRAGVRIRPRTDANLNRYEECLEAYGYQTGGLASIFAGASRLARLKVAPLPSSRCAIRDVAAGVAAPTMVAYTISVLRDAQRNGLDRLYFVSRDGQILLDIAQRLADPAGFGGELRYLYGGRQAWNLAGVSAVSDRRLEWAFDTSASLSMRGLLDRVGIDPEEIASPLIEAGFTRSTWIRPLSNEDQLQLRAILASKDISRLLLRRAAERRHELWRYLTQSGFSDDLDIGVVDLGWYGRVGSALSTVVREAGGKVPHTYYYFGLHRDPPPELGTRARAYFFDSGRNVGQDIGAMPGVINLLECFCAGTHGMVIGYDTHGDEVAPRLSSPVNGGALDWGLPVLRETVDHFVSALPSEVLRSNLDADLRPAVGAVLKAFVVDPTTSEARAWGGIEFSEDQGEAFPRPLASPYSLRDVLAMTLAHASSRDRDWTFASRRLSRQPLRWFMGIPYQIVSRTKDRMNRFLGRHQSPTSIP